MSVTLYGIKNCDTVKKARQWLDKHSVPYAFHDFRKDGLDKNLVKNFLQQIDQDMLINKRGLSWRKLSEQEKNIRSQRQAVTLILAQPTLIKRPVLDVNGIYYVGFDDSKYRSINFN